MRTNCLCCGKIVAVVNGWVEPHSLEDRNSRRIVACSAADRPYSENPESELVKCFACGDEDISVAPNGCYPYHYFASGIQCPHSGLSTLNYLHGDFVPRQPDSYDLATMDLPLIG